MALTLPSAPKNFYTPSLDQLRASLEAVNGTTKGQAALIIAIPSDIEDAWAVTGAAGDTLLGANRGSAVVGSKDVGIITGPIPGAEESIGEPGYKLEFGEIVDIPVYIDGSGVSTAVIIGLALNAGVGLFANGLPDDLKYILKVNSITVTDGALVKVPPIEVIINFSEVEVVAAASGAINLGV